MKKILYLFLVSLLCQIANATDYQIAVMPDTNKVTVTTVSANDTINVTITNLSQTAISEFFLTIYSYDSMFVVENIIDGNANPSIVTDVSDGTIYANQLCTRFIIGSFSQSVSLKLYSSNSTYAHLTFCGKQPFAFFGVAEPILLNCCIGVRGNIDNDPQDIIDISDLVYLVDFMFTGGPASVCLDEANVDGDIGSIVDISDLVLLVDFMFSNEGISVPADCP